jgi:hypothetical protein
MIGFGADTHSCEVVYSHGSDHIAMETRTAFTPAVSVASSSSVSLRRNRLAQRTRPLPTARVANTTSKAARLVPHCASKPFWKVDVDSDKDAELMELERQLDTAVLLERYDEAQNIRDQLTRLQSGAFVDVLSAHMNFYKAFDQRSITDMARCWVQDDSASCKHPIGHLHTGYVS